MHIWAFRSKFPNLRAMRWKPYASRARAVSSCSRVPNCPAEFPARFQLIAAMNPSRLCGCTLRPTAFTAQVSRYRSRISGPLIDRIEHPRRARRGAGGASDVGRCAARAESPSGSGASRMERLRVPFDDAAPSSPRPTRSDSRDSAARDRRGARSAATAYAVSLAKFTAS